MDEWECDYCGAVFLLEKDYDQHTETHAEKQD